MTDTDRVNVARERLEQSLEQLATSEGWVRYLDTQARFHNYSMGNIILIGFQRPDATQVAGFKTWLSMGRAVRKGEKGIAILAPMIRKAKGADGEPHVADDSGRTVFGFRTVYVFDVSQTDGEDLPEAPCHRLEGESMTDVVDVLVGHVLSEGLDIARESIAGGANGYIDRTARRIVIDAGLSQDQAFKTLTHELAHWHDLGPDTALYSRADAEIVAESVAYVVCSALGLDTSGYSLGYVLTWAEGDVAKLRAVAERVNRTARTLLAVFDAELNTEAVAA